MTDPSPYQPGAAGRRVRRSFAFVDLSGFTSLTDTEGDEQAVEVLTLFRNAVRGVAGFNGVRVAKWLGDGAMIVSIETEPLVEAVLEIERRMQEGGSILPLRAGMASGDVILFEGDDYIGRAVNIAARLCDLAGPRQVLAPVDMVERSYPPDAVEHISLKGMNRPVEVVDLQAIRS
ncbi:MAG: adenylate/guanylate cyclase domain-containing protein [Acidimicrobiales bacterium]